MGPSTQQILICDQKIAVRLKFPSKGTVVSITLDDEDVVFIIENGDTVIEKRYNLISKESKGRLGKVIKTYRFD